ncbi:MAG: hypothetical protein IOC66_41595 [Burkholderia sp.]|nr:hypothetical protein [Burkholderia sp.]
MLGVLKSRCMMTPGEVADFMETLKFGLNEPGTNVKSLVSEALPTKMNPQFEKGVVEELATYAAMKAEPASAAPAAALAQPAAKSVTMKM